MYIVLLIQHNQYFLNNDFIIDNTNVANILNDLYEYNFIKGSFEIPDNAVIMITSLQIPYSWYNITSKYNL